MMLHLGFFKSKIDFAYLSISQYDSSRLWALFESLGDTFVSFGLILQSPSNAPRYIVMIILVICTESHKEGSKLSVGKSKLK